MSVLPEQRVLVPPFRVRRNGSSARGAPNPDSADRPVVAADEPRSERIYLRQLHVADACVAVAAGIGAYLVRFASAEQVVVSLPLFVSAVFPALWLVLVALTRAYEPRFLHVGPEEFRRVLHAGMTLSVAAALLSYSLKAELSRGYLLALVVFATGGTLVTRYTLRKRLHRQRASGTGWMRRVVVAGHDGAVHDVVSQLGAARWHGYEVVGVCLPEPDLERPEHAYTVPSFHGLENIAEAALTTRADAVIVLPCHHLGTAAMRRLGWRLERSETQLLVAPGLGDVARQRTTVHLVGALPLLHVAHAELTGIRRVTKEIFDRSVAALAMLVVAPVLLVLVAVIRLDSPGPAIFRQERVGRGDRRFSVLKLRTMTVDAESRQAELAELNESDGVLFKIRDDPRVTRVGRWLRRYSLDELPQLCNVVLGQMSLVGPRPPLPSEVDVYEQDVLRRLAVKPGLTGLWQVSGRADLSWDESVRLDLRYVENWSLLLDVSILWKTGRAVLTRDGAY